MDKQFSRIFCSAPQLLSGIIIILLFWCRLSGLEPDKPVKNYLVDQWETSDGIPSNYVRSLAQTPDGYLWIATSKGLVRFDGKTFTPISFVEKGTVDPMENTIADTLYVDREGTLWIGSAVGLTSYRHQTGLFKTYTTADGITKDRIRHIKGDMRGNLWISFFAGYLNRFSNGKFTRFTDSHGLKGKRINGIVEDRNGNLLFGTREKGVFAFRDGKFLEYPVAGLGTSLIITMYEDGKGELWIGTNQGLLHVTGKGTRKYTTAEGLPDNYVIFISEDSDHNIWAGTVKGLVRVKKKQDGSAAFESTLTPLVISCLLEDSEKSVWVGTRDFGLKRLKDGKFTSFTPLNTRPEKLFFSLFEDREGDTWISALGGILLRYRGETFIETVKIPGLSAIGILSIAEDADGNLWLGTNGKGVFRKEKNVPDFFQFSTVNGLSDNLVTSIFTDSRGWLWFATFDGVSRFRDGVMDSFKTRDGLPGKVVHNVYEDKHGNIWMATDKGITVLKGGIPGKENITHYLPDVSVTCIYEDPSSEAGNPMFWAATHGSGLKRFKNGTFFSYTTTDGMTADFIYQFFEDRGGNFWLMSSSGILRVRKEELNRFADNETGKKEPINCTSFGISDGMKSIEFESEFSRHSALKTGDGEFWFITKKGITIINPAKITVNKVPPPVKIESLIFDEQPVDIRREPGENADRFRGITDFVFRFTAPTFLSPEKVRFKYRLEPVEKEWVFLPPGSERTARYRDLEPGTYTFSVTAGNSEGVWNRAGDSVTFTLAPFFHQTVFFKIIILLLIVALAAGGFYLYKKRPFKKQQEKYKGSSLNPQFAEERIKKLRYLMEMKKVYRDPDISLQGLSEKLSVTSHQLSQILNEKLERNFSDLINSYRIEEAKKLLLKPGADQQKITTVAFDVGFNTTVAFYNAFKKYTGMTPSQYKKTPKG